MKSRIAFSPSWAQELLQVSMHPMDSARNGPPTESSSATKSSSSKLRPLPIAFPSVVQIREHASPKNKVPCNIVVPQSSHAQVLPAMHNSQINLGGNHTSTVSAIALSTPAKPPLRLVDLASCPTSASETDFQSGGPLVKRNIPCLLKLSRHSFHSLDRFNESFSRRCSNFKAVITAHEALWGCMQR